MSTEALRLYDETGNTVYQPYPLNNLANLYSFVNDHRKAEVYARQCMELKETEMILCGRRVYKPGEGVDGTGRYLPEALPYLEEALAYGEREGDVYKVFLYHLNRAST